MLPERKQPAPNRLQHWRRLRGWTQQHLAQLAGVPRSEISAIERQQLTPSVQVALLLAQVLGCTVEELFPLAERQPQWAWSPPRLPWRYWQAEVAARVWLYPAGGLLAPWLVPDGSTDRAERVPVLPVASQTLVVAACDPLLGAWSAPLAAGGVRLLPLERPSREALRLLAAGRVHAAGVHFATAEANRREAAAVLQEPFVLVDVARWQETVALAPGVQARSVRALPRRRLRWLAPAPESAAAQAAAELLPRRSTRRVAAGHRQMAWALQRGWGQVGVCLQLAAEEAGLDYLPLRWEQYQLCIPEKQLDDPRVKRLLDWLASDQFATQCQGLPGVKLDHPGRCHRVKP